MGKKLAVDQQHYLSVILQINLNIKEFSKYAFWSLLVSFLSPLFYIEPSPELLVFLCWINNNLL